VFLHGTADSARAAADAMDRLRTAGAAPSPYAGVQVSIKDLFDIGGRTHGWGARPDGRGAAPAPTGECNGG
jgi:aspartyl-tRNA(Asn)/glutamyl-tRNA(Gln) amidotransferase subunit A